MRTRLIAALMCVALAAAGAGLYAYHARAMPRALAHIGACLGGEGAVPCMRPIIRALLENGTGAEVMDAIARRFPAQQCHYIGHVVGQEWMRREGNLEAALARCERACDSACVHGGIAEAFAEELGYTEPADNTDFDLAHMSPEDIREVGRRLCASRQACHGVGHALFQAYGEIAPSLSACADVGDGAEPYYCYQGVFMEYSDILSSVGMREASSIEYPSLETLRTFCDFSDTDQMRMCFRYFPRTAGATLAHEGLSREDADARIRELCAAQSSDRLRVACIAGIGTYHAYAILSDDQSDALETCAQFEHAPDRAACYVGEVSVAPVDRHETLMRYCETLPEEGMRGICAQAVFYFVFKAGGSVSDVRALCASEGPCSEGARNYALDSWQELERMVAP